jgi:ABC-2 type transport system permease protein
MTFLSPLFFGLLLIVPVWMATLTADDKVIEVVDETGLFKDKFVDTKHTNFIYLDHEIEYIKKVFLESSHDGLLYIPKLNSSKPEGIIYYTKSNTSLETLNMLEWTVKSQIERLRLEENGIDPNILDKIKVTLDIQTVNLSSTDEEKKSTVAATSAGLFGAVLVYFFIFLYGTQVMRGVLEEKTNRIVEVIITSVKPFELMMGKIVGIALVALTQFLLWVILTFAITTFISSRFQIDRFNDTNISQTMAKTKVQDTNQAMEMYKIVSAVDSINIPLLLVVFLFYFTAGYLLYSAMFAAIGSAVDNETDSQQFMFPVTIPLILSFVFAQTIINEPDSAMAFWLSIIPLTSPVVMMVRVPFGVPMFDLILSITLLFISFIAMTWLAARIYKVGILMYGKKPTYREIAKWMFYK